MQFALGWKQIHGSDMAKTYQQCAALAMLVLGEVECGLYGHFIYKLVMGRGPNFLAEYCNNHHSCLTYINKEFLKWMEEHITKATYEVF